jgi:uncharacterized protein (TIGR03000 family)
MYAIVLAMTLAPGNAAPAADIETEIRDLKRSIAHLREEQNDARVEELKLVIGGLRQQLTDEKLDELRRDVRALNWGRAFGRGRLYWEGAFVRGRGVMLPMPRGTGVNRATVAVDIPAGATFVVNDQTIAVPAVNPIFVTPPLEPDKDYFYDCKVTVNKDGKPATRGQRVRVRAGETVRINYENMEAR